MPGISAMVRSINRRILVPDNLSEKRDPISKITREIKTGGVAQVVEGLLCKHEVLSSNPNTAKNAF
jgi:hypothetical protein